VNIVIVLFSNRSFYNIKYCISQDFLQCTQIIVTNNRTFYRALDEAHLKAGVRALAQLHALSYAYFNR
jgi:hypothetical protein